MNAQLLTTSFALYTLAKYQMVTSVTAASSVSEGFHLLPIEAIGSGNGLKQTVVGQIRVGLSVFEKETEPSLDAAWAEEECPAQNALVNFEAHAGKLQIMSFSHLSSLQRYALSF